LGNDSETVNETIKAAVEKYLPLGIKRYSIEALEVRNPKLDNYHFPIDFNETDMAVTETLMSNYLISNNIEPGTYTGENAKNIFEKIYNYLQDFLEMEISKYDSGILYFIYRQMELAEGTRYTEKIRLGMKAKGNVDYDLRDDYQKQDIEQTTLLLTIRHILHSFLKVEISTKTRITKERWTYLLALAKTVLDAGYLYEFLDYSLLDHEVEVSPDYLIRPKSTGGRFDSFKYRQKETEETIKHAVNDIERKSTVKRENEIEEFNKELNQVFTSEFGFSYNDLIFVLTALSISSFSSGYFPPIVIASVNELIKLIQDSDFQHIPEDEIRRIIEYLSLKKGIYSKSTFLHQTNMMRFKERITLCPLIHDGAGNIVYGNQACYNAANIWAAAASGHFPFVINVSTAIQEVIRKIHREEDLKLEGQASQQAIEILGRQNVESQISNFRRLSKNFRKDPACGEIDILCVNATTKIIFVLDVKNTLRRLNAYYAKNSLREFFEGNSSYHKKLLKKKDFVQGNLSEILLHFKINSSDGWIVKEAFITDKLIFAGFHSDNPVDFILLNELSTYLIK
jgi:hypothetical protein